MEQELEEQALVREAVAGSREAFERLVSAAGPGLSAAARKLAGQDAEAEDLVQETLACAFRALATLKHPGAWRSWLFQILVRRHYDRLARRRVPPPARDPVDASDPLTRALSGEARRAVQEVLQTLDGPMREVLTLRYLQDLPLREIAEKTGRPLGTVKFLIHEGLRTFERLFRERMS